MSLYPPIVQDIQPAFIGQGACTIYFALPAYNSSNEIQNVQISIINQRTNASALDPNKYPSGIKIAALTLAPELQEIKNEYNYCVKIDLDDLVNNKFEINQFYKVQLRFTSGVKQQLSSQLRQGTGLAQWLFENRDHFSEWSKVCLVKGIAKPKLQILGFERVEDGGQEETILTSSVFDIIGRLTFDNAEENEYLKSYHIKIYQDNDINNILVDSGEIYTNSHNPNEFNYEIPYMLTDGTKYNMEFTYITNNLYTETSNYNFTIIQHGIDKLNANIIATPDEENGRIKVNIISKDHESFIGNITIRRTSSKSNFHRWEDIQNITYATEEQLNQTWYDSTVESGVWYKYCAQKRNAYGHRGVIVQTEDPVMCLFDDIFLTGGGGRQLKIKFNPSLNEFKYNVTESQQTSIGAKFPYIKRNSANYYRTFPIGGLISSLSDLNNWYDPHYKESEDHQTGGFSNEDNDKHFTSKEEVYGTSTQLYANYNIKNNITEQIDYIYEKEFRNQVYDFLYKHDVKLFRSTTEGNILIKLMNIDFQPMEALGRRLYSFTASAVEVDEANISNYDKYKIQTIGVHAQQIKYIHEVLGQISGTYDAINGDIISNKIDYKYKKFANAGFISKINHLKWLRLEIESNPYVIVQSNGALYKATDSNLNISQQTSGYIVKINDQPIIIKSTMQRRVKYDAQGNSYIDIVNIGVFELKENNTTIKSIQFPYPTTATIDYIAVLEEEEDLSHTARRFHYYNKPGQLYGIFKPSDSIIGKIYNKYMLNYNAYYQRLIDVTGVQIEGQPRTVIYVKDSNDTGFNRHVLQNGYLQLIDNDVTIEGIYFCGIQLKRKDLNDNSSIRKDEFISHMDQGTYDHFSDIKNPDVNGIYKVNQYVVYNGIYFDQDTGQMIVYPSSVIEKVNRDYTLILQNIYEKIRKNTIYYNGQWWPFVLDDDDSSNLGIVLCPVAGSVNYFCEVVKGEY